MWDLCIRGARLFDPELQIDSRGDIAVRDGVIVAIGEHLDGNAMQMVDAQGLLLTCGHVDIHTHVASEISPLGVAPDEAGIQRGVTATGDAGSAGMNNIELFLRGLHGVKTGVSVFLNVHPWGIAQLPEVWTGPLDLLGMAETITKYRSLLCGIKLRATAGFATAYGISGLEQVKALAQDTGLPLMVHLGTEPSETPQDSFWLPPCWEDFCRALPRVLDAGDILSHCYTAQAGGLITPDRRFYTELAAAVARGVLLDAAVALIHFDFSVARQGIHDGFRPHCISTDLTSRNTHKRVFDLATTLSRFLALGLSLEEVMRSATVTARKALHLPSCQLAVGLPATFTLTELREGRVLFAGSSDDDTVLGTMRLVPKASVLDGIYTATRPE